MADSISHLEIKVVKEEHIDDWADTFLAGIRSCRWMRKYFSRQNLSEYDVKLSLLEDLKLQTQDELFLIAYVDNFPAGIIRFDSYYTPGASKIISHFPLIQPKYQRKGIGKELVKKGIQIISERGIKDFWAECWALNRKEIAVYQEFYEKIGFKSQSNRLELCCNTFSFNEKNLEVRDDIEVNISNELTSEFVSVISKAYGNSRDILHSIENLSNESIAKTFLERTKETFEKLGFKVQCILAKHKGKVCASLLIATSKNRGMILEIGVLPEFRGKRIAWHIISQYIVKMKKQKIGEVVLGVDAENLPATSLYERLGFKRTWFGHLMVLVDEIKLGLNK